MKFGPHTATKPRRPPALQYGGGTNSDPCPCEVWSCLVMYYRRCDLNGGPVLDSWAPSSATEPSPPGRLGVIGVVLMSLRRTTRGGMSLRSMVVFGYVLPWVRRPSRARRQSEMGQNGLESTVKMGQHGLQVLGVALRPVGKSACRIVGLAETLA